MEIQPTNEQLRNAIYKAQDAIFATHERDRLVSTFGELLGLRLAKTTYCGAYENFLRSVADNLLDNALPNWRQQGGRK